jgi:hypothetical protein
MSPRRALLALVVAVTPLVQLAGMVPHPEVGGSAAETLAIVAQDPGEWFWIHLLAAAAATLSIVSALALASLVRGRGTALATIGASMSVVGGFLLAFAFAAEAQLMSLAADPSLDPVAMAPLLDLQEEGPAMAMLTAGFPLAGIGSLLLMCGLLRGRVVPRWQPALVLFGTFTSIAATPGLAIGPLLFLPSVIGTLFLAVTVGRGPRVREDELVLAA